MADYAPYRREAHLKRITTFKALPVGAHFRMVDVGPGTPIRKKVSKRCFVYVGRTNPDSRKPSHLWKKSRATLKKHCHVSSWDYEVIRFKTSPIKKRKGRNRGRAMLAGLRRK